MGKQNRNKKRGRSALGPTPLLCGPLQFFPHPPARHFQKPRLGRFQRQVGPPTRQAASTSPCSARVVTPRCASGTLARPVILQDPRARLLVRRHVGPLVDGSSSPLQQKSLLSSIYSRSGRIFYRSRGFSVAIDRTLPALFSVLYNLRARPNTSSHRGMGESATTEYSCGCRCQCLSRATVALPPMTGTS